MQKKSQKRLYIAGKIVLSLFLCVMTLGSIPLSAYGARYSIFQDIRKKVTISMKNATLEQILVEINKQAKVDYGFQSNGKVDKNQRFSLNVKDITVEEALEILLKDSPYDYTLEKDRIVIIKVRDEESKKKEIKIVGKVVDERKSSLPGVTIRIKDTKLGVATDVNGKYTLTIPEIKDIVLVFSFIGMDSQEIKYVGQDSVNVVLKASEVNMQEVVVTGYANVRKESFTGNATTVTRDQLLKTNNKSVIAALQNFDPSFRIRENSLWGSDPNALPEFNIRGESSIAMDKSLSAEKAKQTQRTNLKDNPNLPIFILDGFEVSVEKIYDMDMNRIQSMTILKDAAATAMYGSRAANGVIVVTSVAPQSGEMRVTYSLNGGIELPDLSDYNLCNAREKLEVEKAMGKYTSVLDDPNAQIAKDIEYLTILRQIERGIDTDWLAQPLRNAFNHKHSLNLQGGVESIRYGLDFSYDSNGGVMKGSYRDRMGVGLTLDFRNKQWLQLQNSLTYNTTRTKDSPYGTFSTYARLMPYYPLYDDEGQLLERLKDSEINPVWKAKNLDSYSGKGTNNDITNNLGVNVFILKGLQFKGQFSLTKTDSETESYTDPNDPQYVNEETNQRGELTRNLTKGFNWNINAMFYFNRQFNKHFINAVAGVNVKSNYSESTSMAFKGFQLGNLNNPAYAASQPEKSNISSSENRLFGVLASLNYSYNDVYLLDASFRLDGSSQFGTDKRFAPFWSLGVGVNLHNYSWLKDNWIINTLKIRASYGSTGKVNFPAYAAITTFKADANTWYYTGPASKLIYLGNPRLTWETTKTFDAGFTLGVLNDKFYLTANYYRKETEDLIDEVSIRTSSGFKTYKSNSGSVLNEGFEVNFNSTVYRDKSWNVVINANLASNKNKIVKLGAASMEYNKKILENYNKEGGGEYLQLRTTPLIQYYEGASTTAIYAVRSQGIDPGNGKELFLTKGGLSTYTWCADDQVVVGDNLPDAQGSFGVNVAFQGFYLNLSFMYQWGAQTYNSTLLDKVENADINYSNVDRRVISQRWRKVGDMVPYYDLGATSKTKPTSRFVQDYNYLNFSGLSMGYDFKREFIQKIKLTSLGIRFNANDLCRWSTVKEERGTSYPYAKNYNFTINVGF